MKLAINLPLLVYWQALGEALAPHQVARARSCARRSTSSPIRRAAPTCSKSRGPALATALNGKEVAPVTFDVDSIRKDLRTMIEEGRALGSTCRSRRARWPSSTKRRRKDSARRRVGAAGAVREAVTVCHGSPRRATAAPRDDSCLSLRGRCGEATPWHTESDMPFDEHASGVYTIAATPFHPDGRIDTASIDRLTDFYLESGVAGITVLGVMGEAPKLDANESVALVRQVVKRAGNVPVVVGVTSPGLAPMRALARDAMEAGAAGVMIAPPSTLRTG